MTDQLSHPDDVSAISATDALLDALISGDGAATRQSDAAADLLGQWRDELDSVAAMTAPASTGIPSELGSRPRRWARAHRHAAAATAAVVVLAASTGVAAAASGPSGPLGPLHRALFGTEQPHQLDATAIRVQQLLQSVQAQLVRLGGGVTAGQRARLSADLDRAAALLATDDEPPVELRDQLSRLRDRLTGLPAIPAAPAVTPPSQGATGSGPNRSGGHSGDGSATGDHGGSSGSGDGSAGGTDRQSGSGGSDDSGSGTRDGSVSRSDDGGSGDSGSSDDSTTRSGSGDGSVNSTGSRDGGGSDGGSGDGGGDGGGDSSQTSGDQSGSGTSDSRDSSDASFDDGGH